MDCQPFETKLKIAKKLREIGKGLPPEDEGGTLQKDLEGYPHAFVIACILDRRVKFKKAWVAPDELKKRIGNFHFQTLKKLSKHDWEKYCNQPKSIHPLTGIMPDCLYEAIQQIAKKYDGDASNIWKGNLPSGEIICRFLEFKGVGQKIATMATRILKERKKISDYSAIDVSADVHVQRVFYRLGLISKEDRRIAIYTARGLEPEFPGILDYPTWRIGEKWCKAQKPNCKECPMDKCCPKIGVGQSAD